MTDPEALRKKARENKAKAAEKKKKDSPFGRLLQGKKRKSGTNTPDSNWFSKSSAGLSKAGDPVSARGKIK